MKNKNDLNIMIALRCLLLLGLGLLVSATVPARGRQKENVVQPGLFIV